MALRIDADLIILGNGETIENGSVVTDNEIITYVGSQSEVPETEESMKSPVVMPGMWECHGHFSGFTKPSVEMALTTTPQVSALRCVWDVKEALKAGFTSVREVGGQGIYLNKVIQEGNIIGPRIYGAGNILGTTGGHSDIHNSPLEVVEALASGHMPFLGELADGRAECLKAVRKQIRKGAEVIKFCASGGVMSEIDHPIHQQFSLEEQKAIVEEATRADLAVAAHCHGAAGIRTALEAGVTTIEHGTFLDEELADMMIEKDAILVPTRYVVVKLLEGAEKMGVPDYAMKKVRALANQQKAAIELAIKKGVKIALGTDIFVSGPGNIFTWGDNAIELKFLHEMGMSLTDCIKAATSMGPQTLGKRAPKSGELKVGYEADILLLKKNPLESIEVLIDKENITQVIKSGKKVEF